MLSHHTALLSKSLRHKTIFPGNKHIRILPGSFLQPFVSKEPMFTPKSPIFVAYPFCQSHIQETKQVPTHKQHIYIHSPTHKNDRDTTINTLIFFTLRKRRFFLRLNLVKTEFNLALLPLSAYNLY
jgi:hypothetical protein